MNYADLRFLISMDRGRYRHPLALAPYEAQVYSQNGEDGIIAEIFHRISAKDRFFVEIGSADGKENNTRFLLEQGWRGVWIDSNFADASDVFAEYLETGALRLTEASVTAENIDQLLEQPGVPATIDFLSLDVDQNTSHVWRALCRRCRVVCIEYNVSIPSHLALEVPYDPDKRWDGTNWYGASLKSLEQIGREKQMSLVGCDLLGVNAFFVNSSEARRRFMKPFKAETHWEPARYALVAHGGHRSSPEARTWKQT